MRRYRSLITNPGSAGAAYGYPNKGGYQGAQAELLRVPLADANCLKLPGEAGDALEDDFVLNWRSKCSGKRLFRDLQERYRIKLSPAAFKETMIQSLAASKSETWRLLESIVSDALRSAP